MNHRTTAPTRRGWTKPILWLLLGSLVLTLTGFTPPPPEPYLVKDINLTGAGSVPLSLTVVGDTLFFFADDGVHGFEQWVSDGTAAGTHLVADIWPGNSSSFPHDLVTVGDTLFFGADEGIHGDEL